MNTRSLRQNSMKQQGSRQDRVAFFVESQKPSLCPCQQGARQPPHSTLLAQVVEHKINHRVHRLDEHCVQLANLQRTLYSAHGGTSLLCRRLSLIALLMTLEHGVKKVV